MPQQTKGKCNTNMSQRLQILNYESFSAAQFTTNVATSVGFLNKYYNRRVKY